MKSCPPPCTTRKGGERRATSGCGEEAVPRYFRFQIQELIYSLASYVSSKRARIGIGGIEYVGLFEGLFRHDHVLPSRHLPVMGAGASGGAYCLGHDHRPGNSDLPTQCLRPKHGSVRRPKPCLATRRSWKPLDN